MKTLILMCILLLACNHVGAKEVMVRVVDDRGVPVVGAKTSIYFVNHQNDDQQDGLTDDNGFFSARGSGTNSFGFIVNKVGHYQARVKDLSKDKDHNVEVVLPRVINPIPLYVLRIDDEQGIVFPVHDKWIGFDLEIGDWVSPHGKGKAVDFLLRFRNEFKGLRPSRRTLEERIEIHKRLLSFSNEEWTEDKFKVHSGNWDGLVEMSFPGEGEGILEAKRFIDYSPMKMPHLAPEDGYLSTWKRMVNNYDGMILPKDTGFFLRTRVKRNQQGQIISANYAKFIGRMNAMASTGQIEFLYYFNPAPNDRNLEFDPKKNLFPEDKPGARVYNP